jgi:peptidoglycan/LPS O-acetylase OafA/YrhL
LKYEILSYVFLMWLWIVLRKPLPVAVIISLSALLTVSYPNAILLGIAYTLPFFAGGVAMFVFTSRFGTHGWLALLSLLVLVLSAFAGMQQYAFAIFGAYLVVFLGDRPNPASSLAQKFGDWSYGIYLFGWPVEQLVSQLSKTNDGVELFLHSLPVAVGIGAISWVAVEKPSLKLKQRVALLLSRLKLFVDAANLRTQLAEEKG